MTPPILQPGQIAQPSEEAPTVLPPRLHGLFAGRAQRFESLATGHALGDYLRFMAALCRAQEVALNTLPQTLRLPDAEALSRARSHAMPPLAAQTWPREPVWRDALSGLVEQLLSQAPAPAAVLLRGLQAASADSLDSLADRVLRTELFGDQAGALPFVAAALQVYWTRLAADLGEGVLHRLDTPGVCPCCGSLPVASVIHIDGPVVNLRYLHCSLCNTAWNLARAQCAACGGQQRVSYRHIEGGKGVARAETCDDCQGYLKIFYREKDPDADPVADDLASLSLDILVDEQGYSRYGPNLLLVPG